MRKLLFLVCFLFASQAHAQNSTCPTRPVGDRSNACASTQFVNGSGTAMGGFTPNQPVIGAASGFLTQGTRSGNTALYPVLDSAPVNGQCAQFDSLGGLVPVACPGGGSGSGTVAAGLALQFGFYGTGGTTITGTYGPTSSEQWINPNGSDSNSGLNPTFPKLTPAAALTALSSGGILHVTGGMFTIPADLTPNANTLIDCAKGSGFTEANGANLATLVDFETNSANGAGMQHCIIDGNFANQTLSIGSNMILIGAANNVTLFDNTIQNPAGVGVAVTNGVNANIIKNHFTKGTYDNINLSPTNPSTTLNFHVDGNTSDNLGAHFLEMYGADRGTISNNIVTGFTVNGIVANITSTTNITWVSGPQFTTLRPGNFIICGSGANYEEYFIAVVNSPTSLTLGGSTPGVVRSNQNCIAGPGDLMDITGSFIDIGGNVLTGGTTGGIVPNNFLVAEEVQELHVHDNIISNVGDGCIFIEAIPQGGNIMLDNSYTNNQLSSCAQGQTPFAAKAAIIVDDGAPTGALNQWFDGNSIIDNASNTGFWMGMYGAIVQSEASVGKNTSRGMNSAGIFGGLRSVTLSGGWGSGAVINSSVTNGSSYKIIITAGSSGLSGSPSITINKAVSGSDVPPQPVCSVTATTGVNATAGVSSATIDQDIITLQGTPSAGAGYFFYCKE